MISPAVKAVIPKAALIRERPGPSIPLDWVPSLVRSAAIEVAGHTDGDGEDAFNQALSEKRAQAVVNYLVRAGLPADRFTTVGFGSTQPIASNGTDEGKAQNRRIEFLVR